MYPLIPVEPELIFEALESTKGEQRTAVSMLQSRKLMAQIPSEDKNATQSPSLYCPTCAREVNDPLTCGDCSSVICRVCGSPLEMAEDLGIG